MSWLLSFAVLFGVLLMGLLTCNWLALVFLMELILFTFLFLLYEHNSLSLSVPSVKYFVAQTVGSLCLLIAGLYFTFFCEYSNAFALLILLVGLCLKIGLFPFHFWVIPVMSELPYSNLGLLSIPMKILPLSLLANSSVFLFLANEWLYLIMILSSLSMVSGLLYGLRSLSMREVLGASSISHGGWFLLASMGENLIMYFSMYSIMLLALVYGLNYQMYTLVYLSLLGMAGLPPFTLFFGKLMVLLSVIQYNIPIGFVVVALLTAFLSLFYYLKFALYFFLLHNIFFYGRVSC